MERKATLKVVRFLLIAVVTIVLVTCADQVLWLAPYFFSGGSDQQFINLCNTVHSGELRTHLLNQIKNENSVRLETESQSGTHHHISIDRDLNMSCDITIDTNDRVQSVELKVARMDTGESK